MRSRIGYPVRKADVLAGPGVRDHWFAMGAVDSVDYRLVSRRVWLYGVTTRRWPLLLSFAPPGGFLDDLVAPGQAAARAPALLPGLGAVPGAGR